MEKSWEITGRLGELQLAWLQAHYTAEQLAEALASLPGNKRAFPLNVARRLEAAGGPAMPPPALLLEQDPESQQRASANREQALEKLRVLQKRLGVR